MDDKARRMFDRWFIAIIASLSVSVVLIVSQVQAHNRDAIVNRIDGNAQITADGMRAIVCVLQIDPADRQHENIERCLNRFGFGFK